MWKVAKKGAMMTKKREAGKKFGLLRKKRSKNGALKKEGKETKPLGWENLASMGGGQKKKGKMLGIIFHKRMGMWVRNVLGSLTTKNTKHHTGKKKKEGVSVE